MLKQLVHFLVILGSVACAHASYIYRIPMLDSSISAVSESTSAPSSTWLRPYGALNTGWSAAEMFCTESTFWNSGWYFNGECNYGVPRVLVPINTWVQNYRPSEIEIDVETSVPENGSGELHVEVIRAGDNVSIDEVPVVIRSAPGLYTFNMLLGNTTNDIQGIAVFMGGSNESYGWRTFTIKDIRFKN